MKLNSIIRNPTTHKLLLAGFATASALVFAGASHAAIISQTANGSNASSGSGNYGQEILVDSGTLTDNILTGFSMIKGSDGGGSATGFIDVYTIGTANADDLNFGDGTETAKLAFLGSSTNSVDTTTANNGTSLDWTFANIALPLDTDIFLVHSSDAGASTSFIGTSTRVEGTPDASDYTNITGADSNTLAWGGDLATARGYTTDNQYTVTLVPEPTSLALLGLAGVMALRHRRG